MPREALAARIVAERERQFNLPGSEFDMRNQPSDWVAIATHYLAEEVMRSGRKPDAEKFSDSLVKAAAVILAALEHVETMQERHCFSR